MTLGDEVLTPDSSRFWDAANWQPGKAQPSFDKQYVRDYLVSSGWDRKSNPPALPTEVIEKTSQRYESAFQKLTGTSFQN
jgi:phosphoribosylaminoimidazole-succinocarboxamide synthase